jgi:hypothetical protein
MALLDLQGQILKVPLDKLLGGRDTPPAGGDRGVRLKFVARWAPAAPRTAPR